MSDASLPPLNLRSVIIRIIAAVAITTAIIVIGFGSSAPKVFSYMLHVKATPHWPDLSLVAQAAPAIKIHLAVVVTALVLGAAQLLGPKGTTAHRVMGWSWVALMLTAAISSLFIRVVNNGAFSFIHLFAVWTLIAAPLGVYFARRHKVLPHSRMMSNLFYGGLILAGVFAFLPGRLMWQMFFG